GSWLHSQTWRVAVKPLDLRVIQVAHFHMSGLPEARPGHRGVEIPQGVGAWGPGGVRPVLAGSSWQGTRSDRTQRGEKGNRAGEIGIGLSLPAPDSPAQVSVRVRAAKSSRNRLDGIVICFLQAHGDFLTGKAVLLIGFSGNPQAMGSETWLESGVSRQEDKTQAVRGKLGNPHNTNLGAETLRTTPRDLGLSLSPPLLHQELCQTVSLSPGPGAESAKGPKSRHSMKHHLVRSPGRLDCQKPQLGPISHQPDSGLEFEKLHLPPSASTIQPVSCLCTPPNGPETTLTLPLAMFFTISVPTDTSGGCREQCCLQTSLSTWDRPEANEGSEELQGPHISLLAAMKA
ncbi:hypothetical protein J0S82_009430, partial [Galemys pyrenaicus]